MKNKEQNQMANQTKHKVERFKRTRFVKSQLKGWVEIDKSDRDWDSGISEAKMDKLINDEINRMEARHG
jgi:hypothetical protein